MPIGRWGAVTLKDARLAARGILGDVAKGQDVAQARTTARKAKAADVAADKLTLTSLIEQWDTLGLVDRRPNYRREATRALKAAFPDQLERRADALTRDIALTALVTTGKTIMAGRMLAYSRACYTWALKRGMISSNPFQGLPISAGTVSRDRVLTMEEVALVWSAADRLGYPFGPLFQLLLTAQRREEVAGMGWSELSADQATWKTPKERAKNGKAHIVHLAPEARAILVEVPRFARVDEAGKTVTSDLIFTTTGGAPVSGFGHAKAKLDELIEAARGKAAAEAGQDRPNLLPGWRLHDFRRTAVTWMAENGVAQHVADKLLNAINNSGQGVRDEIASLRREMQQMVRSLAA